MAEDKEYSVIEDRKKRGATTAQKTFAGLVAAGAIGLGGYALLGSLDSGRSVETSTAQEFQEADGSVGFGDFGSQIPEPSQPGFDFGPIQDQLAGQRADLEERNRLLQERVSALQVELSGLSERAAQEQSGIVAELTKALEASQEQNAEVIAQMRNEFQNQMASVRAENEERLQAEREARQRAAAMAEQSRQAQEEALTRIQRESLALQNQLAEGLEGANAQRAEEERLRREQERREAELAQASAQAAAELKARVASEGVIFDEGAAAGSGNVGEGNGEQSARGFNSPPPTRDERQRAFVESGAPAVEVTSSEVIANPSNTILQGTMIQATLDNAVQSDLPGPVTATVNFPVYSFDQSRMLIAPGSKVFGSYSSDIAIGQGRILVQWNRIVTPDGQSVQLAAFGGDQQGRSGITGTVDTRFGLRFGNAALISLIGAAPAIAASQFEDELARDTAQEVGDGLEGATDTAISEYASLPPRISVALGASVTIIADRDLEFYY